MRPRLAVPQSVRVHVQLDAVAVAERLAGHHADLLRRRHFADPLDDFPQDGAFGFELRRVGQVLVMTAAATAEIRAFRRDSLGRGLEDFDRSPFDQSAPLALHLDAHALAGRYVRRQHHAPIHPRQSIPAVDQFLDRDFDLVFDCAPPSTIKS